MQAVQFIAPGKGVFVEVPKPEPAPGFALVRTRHVSLCGSDTHSILYSSPAAYPLRPGVSGHEVIGVVEAFNGESNGIQVGQTVLGLITSNSGMADYCEIPIKNLLPLPQGYPEDHLLQAQQLGTILYAAQNMPNLVNQDVAVIGQGSAGLWWVHTVRRMGARRVIAVDLQAHRVQLSKRYGATHTIHNLDIDAEQALLEITGGKHADVVVEAAGEIESINLAIDLVRRYGFIFYFGVPRVGETMPFNMFGYFRKCLRTQAMVGALNDPDHSCTRVAMELIASGQANVEPMITHHFPFDKALEAYELQTTRDEGAVKIVVDFD
ncbi:MAG: zinc-binding dehydrogenase [Caldilineaceae bacterium]|nr:zinc-binding dehydrogenase [Caldilineaceae bacterium]